MAATRLSAAFWLLLWSVVPTIMAEDNSTAIVSTSNNTSSGQIQVFVDSEQQQCLEICGVYYDDLEDTTATNNNGVEQVINILSYDAGIDLMGRQKAADAFYKKTGIKVQIDLIPDFLGLFDEIRLQLERHLTLYDGFISGPAIVGSAVQLDGFLDLSDYVRDNRELQWLDVLRGFRETIAVYDNSVRMFPLDGDAHFMYYREDVLEAFGLTIPRTWEEYWQVAKAVHGQTYKGQTMVGSCVGIKSGTHLAYWTSLILTSYTQTMGSTQGWILDAQDFTPLMGEAYAEVLKMLEMQATYGPPEVFETCGGGDSCSINIQAMNDGYCALTYNWGDSYKASHSADPPSQVIGLLKVAPTPGTTKVYNRKTKLLEPCNEENCGGDGGMYYDDIGWVNRASYLAFGGWSGSVNKNIDPTQQALVLEYFAFMVGPEVSTEAAIPIASIAMDPTVANGVDPFRTSHLDVEKWVAKGFERTSAESFRDAVVTTLNHPNAAIDIRFAGADRIYSALEEETYKYLEQAVRLGTLPEDEDERQIIRMDVANLLEVKFQEIIMEENAKPETLVPLLEQYQKDLGVYKPPSDSSQSLALAVAMPIVVAILVGGALLAYFLNRGDKVNDSVWKVKREDIIFSDPPEILGSGAFGLVLLAEYRGTQCAVKRVLPPSSSVGENKSGSVMMPKSSGAKSNSYGIKSISSGPKSASSFDIDFGTAGEAKVPSASALGFGSAICIGGKKASTKKQTTRTLREDFISEMRTVSKLRHPSILTVLGAVIEANQEPLLVLEYMDHGSLYDILHNPLVPLEGEILLPMLRDITQGMRFLHSADPQIIHGDLKASNILVDSRFRAKVGDFGLTAKHTVGVGTPFWMSPELLRGETLNTSESDVYAFGIVLYEVFSRKEPYEGEYPHDVLKQVADTAINKRPPVPPGCPQQLAAMMSDCLLGNADERPNFEELDKRIQRVNAEAADKVVAGGGRDKSTISLFDIFPKHIAIALRDGRTVEAEHKDMVTIFFCDIVNYTTISSTLEPMKVANMLDRLYSKFDQLSSDHDVFKVETIGDAYMAVTNLVKDQSADHVKRLAEFAVDAIKAANETLVDIDDPDKGHLNIRVGLHSGAVVADVVGSRNPRYCLFGDTVNTASRMESHSFVNRIHCSDASATLLAQQNCRLSLVPRGKIDVKGKGKMATFWIEEHPSKTAHSQPPPEQAQEP